MRSASSRPGDSHQFVKPDHHAQHESPEEKPRRGAAPVIDGVADSPEQDERANQRVAGAGNRSRPDHVVLQRLHRTLEWAKVLGHGHPVSKRKAGLDRLVRCPAAPAPTRTARQYNRVCEKVHQAPGPDGQTDDQVQYFQWLQSSGFLDRPPAGTYTAYRGGGSNWGAQNETRLASAAPLALPGFAGRVPVAILLRRTA